MSVFTTLGALSLGLLTGCGTGQHVQLCSAGALTSSQSGTPTFTLVPTETDYTIYPGQTEQISVYVQPIGNATGTVHLGGSSLASGLSVTGGDAAIGSTAVITLTAAPNVASRCFVGTEYVFSASQPLNLVATTPQGSFETQVALNIALENPTFKPAATNLPVLTINTTGAAPIVSKDDYVTATYSIADPTNKANNVSGTMGIKGHGNSTWAMPKKPYRLNLDKKAALLGMQSNSNWILLANYDDKTMLRNDVSFQMSSRVGMFWTPSTSFVEVYLNNSYQGTYELSEKVEVSKTRLNIGSIDDTDVSGANLTGGYLAEIDHTGGETYIYPSPIAQLPIGLADPDPPVQVQQDYFTAAVNAAESSMYAANFQDPTSGWRASWDEASVVNYFLVEELAGNQDAADYSSDYFYKPRSDPKFYRGPVWDMDVTFGNINYDVIQNPNVPWVAVSAQWYVQLLKDPTFLADVKTRWAAIRPQMVTLPAYIDTRAAALNQAAANNYSRWTTMGELVWPNSESAGSYQGEVGFLKSWLNQRIAYMDATYGK